MIVFHAAFCTDSLLLWAESPDRNNLVTTVSELGVPAPNKKRATVNAVAWLPSTAKGPVASAALLNDDTSAIEKTHLAPCRVTALPLDLGRAIPLLAACAGKPLLRPGLLAGADLCYWAAALRFAAGLVMRGQFLPGLKTATACWQPFIIGEDIARLHSLEQAMPPAARAVVLTSSDSPPQISAQTVLRQFLDTAVDS